MFPGFFKTLWCSVGIGWNIVGEMGTFSALLCGVGFDRRGRGVRLPRVQHPRLSPVIGTLQHLRLPPTM